MSSGILTHLYRTNTVAVITTRPSGDRVVTPIWSVVVDGVGYLRSAYGPDAVWYRRARSGRPVAFSLADGHLPNATRWPCSQSPQSTSVPVDADIQSAVDDALTTKYASERSSLATMLTDLARGCTLRVDAA
jgi:hypothetical protein